MNFVIIVDINKIPREKLDSYKFIIEKLKRALGGDLPGRSAHQLMVPSVRIDEIFKNNSSSPLLSAVMILLYPKDNTYHIVLIQRPFYPGVHSKQISFPGGSHEVGDKSLEHTAIRETEEEIGIDDSQYTVIGELSSLYIPPSNFQVHPFVGIAQNSVHFKADAIEVEKVIEIPLSEVLNKHNIKTVYPPERGDVVGYVPAFVIDNQIIWGATAMILSEFIHIIEKADLYSLMSIKP